MTLERGYLVARKSSSCVSVWEERTSFVEMKKYIFQSYPVCHLQQIDAVSTRSVLPRAAHVKTTAFIIHPRDHFKCKAAGFGCMDFRASSHLRDLPFSKQESTLSRAGKQERMRENQSIVRMSRISVAWMRGNQPFPQSVYLVGWFW